MIFARPHRWPSFDENLKLIYSRSLSFSPVCIRILCFMYSAPAMRHFSFIITTILIINFTTYSEIPQSTYSNYNVNLLGDIDQYNRHF